jgi:hypothetical protein
VNSGLTFDQAVSLLGVAVAIFVMVGGGLQWWMMANVNSGNAKILQRIDAMRANLEAKIDDETKAIREDLSDHEARIRVLEDRHVQAR